MKYISFFILTTSLSFFTFAQPNGGGSGVTDNDLQLNTITTSLPFMAITPD